MSENPFRPLPPSYFQSPVNVSNPLKAPAIILLAIAILFLLVLILTLPKQVVQLINIDLSTPRGAGEFIGQLGGLVVLMSLTIIVILGSISMLRLKAYRLAFTGAMAAMIPLCSPCVVLSIPFGIWAMVLLVKPEVKARFG